MNEKIIKPVTNLKVPGLFLCFNKDIFKYYNQQEELYSSNKDTVSNYGSSNKDIVRSLYSSIKENFKTIK